MNQYKSTIEFIEKNPIVSLENLEKNISIKISPHHGSNLFSIKRNGVEYINTNFETLKNNGFTGNYVLFPFPNRVENKKYTFSGKDYKINIDRFGIKDLIHGFVFDKKWEFEEPIHNDNFISCKTFFQFNQKNEEFKFFPFEFAISLNYILTNNRIKIVYQIENLSSNVMPFGFGLHPFFKTIPDKESVFLSIPTTSVMETDENLIPTGRLLSTINTPQDISNNQSVANLSLDHVYTNIDRKKIHF